MKYLISLTALFLFFACENNKGKETSSSQEKSTVAVVNYPLYYFAKTIGGDNVNVYLPSIDGDPAYWQPDARQVNNFQKADIILANGAGFAKWMEKVSLPSSKIVVTSDSFKDQWIEIEEGVSHSHGPEGEHVHKGMATTTWLNFKFSALQAEEVYKSLVKVLPKQEAQLSSKYETLKRELLAMDANLHELASKLNGTQIIASHPVYQYMEEAYGFQVTSMHWEPNEMPGEDEWKEMKHLIEHHQAEIMIYEDDPLPEIKSKLEDMGIKLVIFNPCGNRPEAGDFLEVMRDNLADLNNYVSP